MCEAQSPGIPGVVTTCSSRPPARRRLCAVPRESHSGQRAPERPPCSAAHSPARPRARGARLRRASGRPRFSGFLLAGDTHRSPGRGCLGPSHTPVPLPHPHPTHVTHSTRPPEIPPTTHVPHPATPHSAHDTPTQHPHAAALPPHRSYTPRHPAHPRFTHTPSPFHNPTFPAYTTPPPHTKHTTHPPHMHHAHTPHAPTEDPSDVTHMHLCV